jgi:hypothetical protein
MGCGKRRKSSGVLGIEVGKPRRGAVWRNHGSTCRWLSGFPFLVLVEAFVDAEGGDPADEGQGDRRERKKERERKARV